MDRKGNLAIFESSNISETEEVTPTKIGVHALYINFYLHEFFEPILRCNVLGLFSFPFSGLLHA